MKKKCYSGDELKMRAAKSGDHSKVLKLLEDGADPNTKEVDTVKH